MQRWCPNYFLPFLDQQVSCFYETAESISVKTAQIHGIWTRYSESLISEFSLSVLILSCSLSFNSPRYKGKKTVGDDSRVAAETLIWFKLFLILRHFWENHQWTQINTKQGWSLALTVTFFTSSFHQWGWHDAKIEPNLKNAMSGVKKEACFSQHARFCFPHWENSNTRLFVLAIFKSTACCQAISQPRSATLGWDEKEVSQSERE